MSNLSKLSSDTIQPIQPVKLRIHLKIVGLLNTVWFQKAKRYAMIFSQHLPKEYAPPEIIPYLEVEWNEYLLKHRRKFGGKYYDIKKPLVVYKDGEVLGDEQDLINLVTKLYQISVLEDFEAEGIRHLKQYIEDKDRTHIFMSISIDNHFEGYLVFVLFNDVCPNTCSNFLRMSMKKRNGYSHSPVHRICKESWIQFGGWKLKGSGFYSKACENYAIPHDRRGVLSMCHNGKHTDNTSQFFVTLNPTPWMDYLYCAFGQLVIGDDVLTKITEVETSYECPLKKISICQSGLYSFYHIIPWEDEKLLQTIFQRKSAGKSEETINEPVSVIAPSYLPMLPCETKGSECILLNTLSDHPKLEQKVYHVEQKPISRKIMEARMPFDALNEKQMAMFKNVKPMEGTLIGPNYQFNNSKQNTIIAKKIDTLKSFPTDVIDTRDVISDASITKYHAGVNL